MWDFITVKHVKMYVPWNFDNIQWSGMAQSYSFYRSGNCPDNMICWSFQSSYLQSPRRSRAIDKARPGTLSRGGYSFCVTVSSISSFDVTIRSGVEMSLGIPAHGKQKTLRAAFLAWQNARALWLTTCVLRWASWIRSRWAHRRLRFRALIAEC